MDRYRRERSPYRERKRTHRSTALTYKKLQSMPLNLRKQAVREARNKNQKILGKPKKRQKKATARRIRNDFERSEHNAMLCSTSRELRKILASVETLSDIPHDISPEELLGELHQHSPTIADLKRAIAAVSRAEQKRQQRERREERCRRRGIPEDLRREHEVATSSCSTGELVHSNRRNGHDHRAFVSWRFLWRCFGLFNVDTNQPIDDRAGGRAHLKDLGIENAATLKFVHRVKYFGRKRHK